jgi:hypothetical protein
MVLYKVLILLEMQKRSIIQTSVSFREGKVSRSSIPWNVVLKSGNGTRAFPAKLLPVLGKGRKFLFNVEEGKLPACNLFRGVFPFISASAEH